MKLPKLAITLTACVLLFGCTSKSPQIQSSPIPTPSPSELTPTAGNTSLKSAVEELRMIQLKIKNGINEAGYSVLIAKTWPVVQKARGDAKALAGVKSAFQGHQLALKFWQCDRVEGYHKLHQCRGQVLSAIFAKYPNLKTQAKAVVQSEKLSTISAKLDKEEILHRIWKETSADIETAHQMVSFVHSN